MHVKEIRRQNLRSLAELVGGITRLANRLDKTQSQLSHLIGRNPIKNIGDKVAREAERAFNKPSGWLDRDHGAYVEFRPSLVGNGSDRCELCKQVPLITWEEAKDWHYLGYHYQLSIGQPIMLATVKVSVLAFALKTYCESMQTSTGISFPKHTIVIADPDEVARPGSFVICKMRQSSQEASLKQLVKQGGKRYFRSLNPRFPIVECTVESIILGVVKQSVMNFHANGYDSMGEVKKEVYTSRAYDRGVLCLK